MNILYCRKSTDSEDRQVLSIDSQKNELLNMATQDALTIDKIFTESKSAKAPGRPEFQKLINLIQKNKGCILYAWKLDRLSRNSVDSGTIQWLLQQGVIEEIRTFERRYYPTDNVLLMSVELGMANQYLRDLSTNVKRGIRAKLEKGGWTGVAPIGYLNDRVNHTVYPDPERSPHIKKLFELFTTKSYGAKELTKKMFSRGFRTRGGKKVSTSVIYRILHNTFYAGVISQGGKTYLGAHVPLITQTQFDDCQQIFSPNRPRKQHHFYPLQGYMTCAECGCALTASTKKGHTYYYCTNGKNVCEQHKEYLQRLVADQITGSTLGLLRLDVGNIEIMYEAAKERLANSENQLTPMRDNILIRQNLLKEKQIRLENTYLDGLLPRERYELKISEYAEQETCLKNELKQLKTSGGNITLELTKKAFLLGHSAECDYLYGDDEHKREVLEKVLWNLQVKDKNVQSYQFKGPFQIMAETPKNGDFIDWQDVVKDVRTKIQQTDRYIYVPSLDL
jgi:DNA invertase Pin-like site-specific DNA recombinase